jgi:glutamate dehydrogenase
MKASGAQLFQFAASGALSSIKALVAEGVDPAKEVNYDSRTALHLAAAEGHLEVVKYLVSEVKVPLNPLDRWENSPLADAILSKHEAVATYLHEAGAQLNANNEMGRRMCRAAAEGSLMTVDFLLKSGVPVGSSDCDGRTALHLAAAAGHVNICERLIAANADVNVVDRWGATPISDAVQFKHFELAQMLRSASAKVADLELYKTSDQILSAIHQTLGLLCSRDNWSYGAAWLPSNGQACIAEAWYADTLDVTRVAEWRQVSEATCLKIDNSSIVGRVSLSNQPEWVHELGGSVVDMAPEVAARTGFKTSLGLPILVNGVQLCILELRSFQSVPKSTELIQTELATAARMIGGNLFQVDASGSTPATIRGYQTDQLNEVFRTVMAGGFFTESVVRKEVDWYFTGLGMHEFYWKQFTPTQISQHVMAFIAAKVQGQTTGTSGAIRYKSEEETSALYIYPVEEAADVERRIDSRWLGEGYSGTKPAAHRDHGVSVKQFLTAGTAAPHSTQKLSIYVVSSNQYVVNPTTTNVEHEASAWKVASGSFLCEKSFQARKRYEDSLTKALKARGATIEIDRPTQRATTHSDSIVITVTYKRGSTHSFFSSMSQLLVRKGLDVRRKYVETFANGYVAYSFHTTQVSQELLDEIKALTGMTWLLPRTSLSPLVDSGAISLPVSQWAYCAWKFVYHFLASSSDEWNSVFEVAKNDVNARAQLLKLKKRLQTEAATEARIAETIMENPDLLIEMYADFKASFAPANGSEGHHVPRKPSFNEALWAKIQKTIVSPVDQEILRTLLNFNRYILKTNFYKSEKTALSFRMDPAFLADCDYTVIPYGLFLVIGAEFRGFHVRFDDVARGGIRMIKSRNKQLWQRNAEGLFDENYNLAYTQTLKNKDIPESGSKGTVFLSVDHQDKDESAFRKYIDALLDCVLPSPDIVDHLGVPEILFFGPDEGTANFMDWAALHSKSRGYKFWSALTTGKSEALGGIPHDVFGMTTRGVHQYVLGLIRKLGLDESKLTKLQTGGPDGDLGSNEIKISKDKTIAIVDGSGVIYDPEGLNRKELERLAHARKMVVHFDRSLLSPKGFLVLIDDQDITLPDGRQVDSGMNFRNNFHLDPLASAELFVPCGGRPAAVNLSNVDKLFIGPDHKPIFKYIVEGANLFFTQEARLKLEEAGVVLFKDASANKGGVTSSSSEVLASLCMVDEEHSRLMCIKDGIVPDFYKRYVVDTQNRIESNADAEFECIWAESLRDPSVPRCIITDKLSRRINELNYQIRDSGLWDDKDLVRTVLAEVIPHSLQQELGLDKIIERLPKSYVDATLSSHLASRYVYSHGLAANEFAFYQFMAQYRK